MDESQGQRNDDLVVEIDRLIVEAHAGLEHALDGKTCVPDAAPVRHEQNASWSQGGSYVRIAFFGEEVHVSASHPAPPLEVGERLEDRIANERRDGRRIDNKWMSRDAQAIADVVVSFLVTGSARLA